MGHVINKKNLKPIFMICMIAILFVGCAGSQYDKQLELGYKYIQEEKYEEAIIRMNKAIKIDAKRPDAYIGLGDVYVTRCGENTIGDTNDALALGYKKSSSDKIIDAYIRLAGTLVEKEKIDWAIQLLDIAYQETKNEKLKDGKKELIQKISIKSLKNLYDLLEAGDWDKITELMKSENQIVFALASDKEPLLYFPKSTQKEKKGQGIGIYVVESEIYGKYFLYYGQYEGNARKGRGVWFGVKGDANYKFEGDWNNDKPNGKGEVKEWYSDLEAGMTIRDKTGLLVDGLWHGDMQWNFIYPDKTYTSTLNFKDGVVTVLGREPDGKYTVYSNGDDIMVFEEEDVAETHGIIGFQSFKY